MLNPFPIQFLSLFAYAVLRFVVGLILMYLGIRHFGHRKELTAQYGAAGIPLGSFFSWYTAFIEVVIGLMFLFGFYTQIAAIFGALLSLKFLYLSPRVASPLVPGRLFYVLLFACSLSLFVTGAGVFALDLPL